MTTCPQCHVEVKGFEKECSACGILFAKWEERETNLASGNVTRYQQIAKATSSEFNWTILGIFATTLAVVFYMLGQRS